MGSTSCFHLASVASCSAFGRFRFTPDMTFGLELGDGAAVAPLKNCQGGPSATVSSSTPPFRRALQSAGSELSGHFPEPFGGNALARGAPRCPPSVWGLSVT
jgi:hypothetical protein